MINKNKDSYNAIASQWSEFRNKTALHKYVIKFEEYLNPNSYVLDLGCGTGYPNLVYLNKQDHYVYGIDIASNMLEYAKNLELDNTAFELVNFLDFEHNKKFDGIIAFDSLFHLPIDKHIEAFKKVSELLNVGGYFFFTHGKTESTVSGMMYDNEFLYSTLNKDETIKVLEELNFEITESIVDYKDQYGHRELIVIAKKIL